MLLHECVFESFPTLTQLVVFDAIFLAFEYVIENLVLSFLQTSAFAAKAVADRQSDKKQMNSRAMILVRVMILRAQEESMW